MSNSKLPIDQNGNPIQALALASNANAAIGLSSVTIAIPANTDIVRIAATAGCRIKFGPSSVTASVVDTVFPIGVEVFKVPAGATHLAVIQEGAASGALTVSATV